MWRDYVGVRFNHSQEKGATGWNIKEGDPGLQIGHVRWLIEFWLMVSFGWKLARVGS